METIRWKRCMSLVFKMQHYLFGRCLLGTSIRHTQPEEHTICRNVWTLGNIAVARCANNWLRFCHVNAILQNARAQKDSVHKMDAATKHTLATTKQILLDNGCSEVEFYESPEVIHLSLTEVKYRLRRLKSLNVGLDVTPVMVSLAEEKTNSVLKKLIKKYCSQHGGHFSQVRQLRSRLNLSDDDLKLLADSGAKLLHSTGKIKGVECLEWLMWKGYSIKDIAEVCEVLDKSVDVISIRYKDIASFGMDCPPLEYLCLNYKKYEKLLKRFRTNPQAVDAIKMTGGWMHARSSAVTKFKEVQPVWDYLLSQGFNPDDIKKNITELLKTDFELLQKIVRASKILTKFPVDLHVIALLSSDGIKARKAALKKLLNCSEKDLPSAQREAPFALMYAQEPYVYFENLQFLVDAGFTLEVIVKCPVIIGHRPEIVKHYWSFISEWNSAEIKEIMEDKVKLLETLQYEIEKESNFMQGILI